MIKSGNTFKYLSKLTHFLRRGRWSKGKAERTERTTGTITPWGPQSTENPTRRTRRSRRSVGKSLGMAEDGGPPGGAGGGVRRYGHYPTILFFHLYDCCTFMVLLCQASEPQWALHWVITRRTSTGFRRTWVIKQVNRIRMPINTIVRLSLPKIVWCGGQTLGLHQQPLKRQVVFVYRRRPPDVRPLGPLCPRNAASPGWPRDISYPKATKVRLKGVCGTHNQVPLLVSSLRMVPFDFGNNYFFIYVI